MVVFTCYHCGDSLQKPKVDKHINIECKKKFLNPRLTCVDCFVDFDRKTFVEHTKCITEEQRYSGKGFVPKPSSNKGEKKQQSWFDIIQVVSKKPKLQDSHRKLLKVLCNYPNVPRKQSRFNKFINASLKHVKVAAETIDEVFKLIDDEFRLNFEINEIVKNDSSKSQQPNKSENGDTVVAPTSDNSPEEKIEKDKWTDIENTNDVKESSAVNGNVDENGSFEVVEKKKKSKKGNVENEVINIKKEKPENHAQPNKNLKRPLENSFEEDISVKSISKKKLKKLKLKEIQPCSNDDSQIDLTQNNSVVSESNETTVDLTQIEDIKTVNGVNSQENISKKEKKEKKKRSKSESELKPMNGSMEFESAEVASQVLTCSVPVKSSDNIESVENLNKKSKKEKKNKLKSNPESDTAELKPNEATLVEIKSADNIESVENLSKKEKKKKKKSQLESEAKNDSLADSTQNGSVELELNEPTSDVTPVEETKSVNKVEPVENLSRKEKKEKKKKLKYEAELKVIEAEVVQSNQPDINNQENETDKNKKREKKKKRKLNEVVGTEEISESKKTKLAESETCENVQPDLRKFDWEEVIRTVLEKAEGKQISLKKLSKKVVTEYQSCHSEETSYDNVLRKFNKKIMKLPFVQIAKDRAILIT